MKFSKIFFIFLLNVFIVCLLLLQVTQSVSAAGGVGNTTIKLENPLKDGTNNAVDFVGLVLTSIVLPIGAVVATLAIIYSGFLLVMARGNDKELPRAKRAFLYSVIGTGIILGAWGIAVAVQNTINQITRQ